MERHGTSWNAFIPALLKNAGLPRLAIPTGVGFAAGEAEFFEFGDELAEPLVVAEPRTVVGELVVGQDPGGGLEPARLDRAGAPRPQANWSVKD